MKTTSVFVISMLLRSRHNAAVLDECSCCPSVGVWVSMGGWLAGRPRWRTCSPLIWEQVASQGDFTTWSMARSPQLTAHREAHYITLIHLLRGLQCELKDLIILYILNIHWQPCLEGLSNQRADGCSSSSLRKHFLSVRLSSFLMVTNHEATLSPQPAVIQRQVKMIIWWLCFTVNIRTAFYTFSFSLKCLKCHFFYIIMHHYFDMFTPKNQQLSNICEK